MGRPYKEELALLPSTIKWASAFPIDPWKSALARVRSKPAIFVASGGSYCAAVALAALHTRLTGRFAMAMTPLEFGFTEVRDGDVVWLISASGSNQDILGAFKSAQDRGCHIVVLCARPQSPLVLRASSDLHATVLAFELQSGSDGFLATNSLMAFLLLGIRLFGFNVPEALDARPPEPELLASGTLVVLYADWMKSVALDLESRFTEAALGNVQIADYRNFAHGRHHWMAKRGKSSQILALVTPAVSDLADETVSALPPEIPVVRWIFDSDEPGEIIRGIGRSMALSGAAAEGLGYDPGRPGVPEFGHVIYNLAVKAGPQPRALDRAIERKADASIRRLADFGELNIWLDRLSTFRSHLRGTHIQAVAFDYDGTLVSTPDRFMPMAKPMADQLGRLLGTGMKIGIATGRGKSVWKELRSAIDSTHWDHVVVGYYNGGCIRPLGEGVDDLCDRPTARVLVEAAAAIRDCATLTGLCSIEERPTQITVTGTVGLTEIELWNRVMEAVWQVAGVKVVRSSHSVDVIETTTSKRAVVEKLATNCRCGQNSVLSIGDRGAWPGNDAELLALPSALSVDEVSSAPSTCWNLLPPGVGGLHGTLYYCDRIAHGRYTGV